MRPVIGIIGTPMPPTEKRGPAVRLSNSYCNAVERAGGAPVILSPFLDEATLATLFERLDGVLLAGGPDIAPTYFGEEPHPALEDVYPELDRSEVDLSRRAYEADKPLFGICRGAQVMNVALGGTLIQDIPAQLSGAMNHRPDLGRAYLAHDFITEPGSALREIVGVERLPVNSIHHQAIREPAPGFVVTAFAEDGVIEGIEHPGRRYCLGVQFHPEELAHLDGRVLNLFRSFVAAAASSPVRS
ncbi:MAG: gamma-glutamyl-gamma-aminobutyrate hydrolase family protein [Chloroflexi bacterium]|nr:gamma-glutamyl-gamma-aminobutyrate hydrolase family protein [Chloroflexota bacterium]